MVKYKITIDSIDDIPLAIWEIDLSSLRIAVDNLKRAGVTEFGSYLKANPEVIVRSIANTRVLNSNKYAMQFYANNELQPWTSLQDIYSDKTHFFFEKLFFAVAHRKRKHSGQIAIRISDSHERYFKIVMILLGENESNLSRALFIANDITEKRVLEKELQFYSEEIVSIAEEERKRIARGLHDHTLQGLANLFTNIDEVIMMEDRLPEDAIWLLRDLRNNVGNILKELRQLSYDLRSPFSDEYGLISSLEQLLSELHKQHNIDARIETIGRIRPLGIKVELSIFRIVQEALRNIVKHASASDVKLSVSFSTKSVRIDIMDNGVGFDLPHRMDGISGQHGLGLIGMREYALLCDGVLTVDTKRNKGTKVTVDIPLK